MAFEGRSILRGFLAGATGGVIGTVVLNVFQKGSIEGTRPAETKATGKTPYTRQQEQLLGTFEKAHMETAEHLANAVGARVPRSRRKQAAPVVEYAFGALCAGVYGAVAEYLPSVTAGFGTVYGTILFVGASEAVLPALGFVPPPAKRTPVQHIGGLAGNAVYGATVEGARRLMRRAIQNL